MLGVGYMPSTFVLFHLHLLSSCRVRQAKQGSTPGGESECGGAWSRQPTFGQDYISLAGL